MTASKANSAGRVPIGIWLLFALILFSGRSAHSESLPTPGSRKFIILAPIEFQFSLMNNNPQDVRSYLTSAGYTGEMVLNKACTIPEFDKALNSDVGVLYFNTHGSNQSFLADPFPLSDFPSKTTKVAAAYYPGDSELLVQSTEGFPPKGRIKLSTLSRTEYVTYNAKTPTSFRDFSSPPQDFWGSYLTAVEWTSSTQALLAAQARFEEYKSQGYTSDEIGILEHEHWVAPAYFIEFYPSFVRNRGAMSAAVVYADACSSAGHPDPEATDWDDAFLAAGCSAYFGYNVDMNGIGWPIYSAWLDNSSPRIIHKVFSYLTDGVDRMSVGDALSSAQESHLVLLAAGSEHNDTVLYHLGSLAAEAIPAEGEVEFGQTYSFSVSITNPGFYMETYQLNLAVYDQDFQELSTTVSGPLQVRASDTESFTLSWPVDPEHGVTDSGTYHVGIGLWPEDPDYSVEPILDTVGTYQYVVPSLPERSISGRIVDESTGNGLLGVPVAFSNGAGQTQTNRDGYYTQSVAYGWKGSVTPSLNGWKFTPLARIYSTPIVEDRLGQNFTAIELSSYAIVTERASVSVNEGSRFWFGVKLSRNPGGPVTVVTSKVSGDGDLAVGDGGVLNFSELNWDVYQNVRIDAAEDDDESNGAAVFELSAAGWASELVTAIEVDDDGGSVRVVIRPPAARVAGAGWRVNGGAWQDSGEAEGGLPFFEDLVVEFREIAGWSAPPPVDITLNSVHPSEEIEASYTLHPGGTGALRVDMSPGENVPSAARWRIDGGEWLQMSQTFSNVAAGLHNIEYQSVDGLIAPGPHLANVVANTTTVVHCSYSSTESCHYVSTRADIQSIVDNAEDGDTIVLNDGHHVLPAELEICRPIHFRSMNGPSSTFLEIPEILEERCINICHPGAIVQGISFTSGTDRRVQEPGGAVRVSSGCLRNSVIHDSVAESKGGGLYLVDGRVENCIIKSNIAHSAEGGGVLMQGGELLYCLVLQNHTEVSGPGGVSASGGLLRGCEIRSNSANPGSTRGDAGGIWLSSDAIAEACLLTSNTAAGDAGGVYISGDSRLENCVVHGNSARGNGGGIRAEGNATIMGCLIENNHSLECGGGGAFVHGGVTFKNCTIADNSSFESGGGIFSNSGQVSIEDCDIRNNVANLNGTDWDGGGGIFVSAATTTVRRTLLWDNDARTGVGGGIFSEDGSVQVNNEMCGNRARLGGGLYNDGNLEMSSCTVTANEATEEAGGIFFDSDPATVTNTIVAMNSAGSGDVQIHLEGGGTYRFKACLVDQLPIPAPDCFNGPPGFVDATARDYRLRPDSQCVDAGVSEGMPDQDLNGVPRPLDGGSEGTPAPDIGAYEFVPPCGAISITLDPSAVLPAGGRWRVEEGIWHTSGETLDYLAPGIWKVEFLPLDSWRRPDPMEISVEIDVLAEEAARYIHHAEDSDSDGILDYRELDIFGHMGETGSGNADGDGEDNATEITNGTDPLDASSVTDSVNAYDGWVLEIDRHADLSGGTEFVPTECSGRLTLRAPGGHRFAPGGTVLHDGLRRAPTEAPVVLDVSETAYVWEEEVTDSPSPFQDLVGVFGLGSSYRADFQVLEPDGTTSVLRFRFTLPEYSADNFPPYPQPRLPGGVTEGVSIRPAIDLDGISWSSLILVERETGRTVFHAENTNRSGSRTSLTDASDPPLAFSQEYVLRLKAVDGVLSSVTHLTLTTNPGMALMKGWNLMSMPGAPDPGRRTVELVLEGADVEGCFSGTDGCRNIIPVADDARLSPWHGYWVHLGSNHRVDCPEVRDSDSSCSFPAGWSLLSIPAGLELTVSELSSSRGAVAVWEWQPGGGTFGRKREGYLDPETGYFIFATSPFSLNHDSE